MTACPASGESGLRSNDRAQSKPWLTIEVQIAAETNEKIKV